MSSLFMVEADQGALIDSARFTVDDGLSAARALASSVDADERFEFARAVVNQSDIWVVPPPSTLVSGNASVL